MFFLTYGCIFYLIEINDIDGNKKKTRSSLQYSKLTEILMIFFFVETALLARDN